MTPTEKTPCLRCPDRCIGCHGQDAIGRYICSKYGTWKLAHEEAAARRDQAYREEHDVLHTHMEGSKVYRNRKKKVPR